MGRTDAAWLAGLFDGEGSIVNTRRSQRGYSLRITITNTCRPLLERVREVTGTGKIVNQRNATERTKACWYWTCGSKNACNLLAQMRPWLIVKADKADAAIERERVREAARVT